MRCEQVEQLIARSVDNELSVKEVGSLRLHLADCPACEVLSAEARELSAWFVKEAPVQIPSGFAQKVTAMAFAQETASLLSPAQDLSLDGGFERLQGGGDVVQGSFGGGSESNRFLMRATAMAAILLLALGMGLYVQRSVNNKDLIAVEPSLEDELKNMDDLNENPQLEAIQKETIKKSEESEQE